MKFNKKVCMRCITERWDDDNITVEGIDKIEEKIIVSSKRGFIIKMEVLISRKKRSYIGRDKMQLFHCNGSEDEYCPYKLEHLVTGDDMRLKKA